MGARLWEKENGMLAVNWVDMAGGGRGLVSFEVEEGVSHHEKTTNTPFNSLESGRFNFNYLGPGWLFELSRVWLS